MNVHVKGTWIQTYKGHRFDAADPRPEAVDIDDIAMSLSRACRYAGHCISFYSVAEHCVLMAELASPEHKLTALMHDASEAYLVDIPRPIKPLLKGYYELESNIMAVIAEKYGFAWPLPKEVTNLDMAMLSDERAQNMAKRDERQEEWGNLLEPLGVKLQLWTPRKAAEQFLVAFRKYGGRP